MEKDIYVLLMSSVLNSKMSMLSKDLLLTFVIHSWLIIGIMKRVNKKLEIWLINASKFSFTEIVSKVICNFFQTYQIILSRLSFCIIDKDGVRVEEPRRIETKWDFRVYKEAVSEKIYGDLWSVFFLI